MTPPRVEDYPDVLPLVGRNGSPCGLFSDLGSWLAITAGAGDALTLWDGRDDRRTSLVLRTEVRRRTVWCDRIELDTRHGPVTLAYAGPECLLITGLPADRVAVDSELPRTVTADGLALGKTPGGSASELLAANRARWNDWLARAHHHAVDDGALARRLSARAVATLGWNWRAATGDLRHGGVVPSPFAYPGFWAWDSYKHAHALARVCPDRAAEQLRAQLARCRDDGMVPDTAMPQAARDNWRNGKPPLLAWALEALQQHQPTGALADLIEQAARHLRWWDQQRRAGDEPLHRYGGDDHETATWDSGWDLSARFAAAPLQRHGTWQLLGLWPCDLAAYQLVEAEAMARLHRADRAAAASWRDRAGQLRHAMQDLWSPHLGAFADVRPALGTTDILSLAGCLPAWAGAATPVQLRRLRTTLRDAKHFDTAMPLPALARSQPAFDPDGYWNGSVWLDHAALALTVLGDDGSSMRCRLLEAVDRHGTFYECYNPMTGEPARGARPAVPQFSWSAAAVLELLWGGPLPHPPRSN